MTISLRERLKERRRLEQGLPPLDPEPVVEVPVTPARQPKPMKARPQRAPRVLITQPTNAPKTREGETGRECRTPGCTTIVFGKRRYCDAHWNRDSAHAWYEGKKARQRAARIETRGDTTCSECGCELLAQDRGRATTFTCSAECKRQRRNRLNAESERNRRTEGRLWRPSK